MPGTTTLIPYIRQSRKKEQTISLASQREIIQAWAKAHDVTLADEVVEQGVSGSKPWRERGLGYAIIDVQEGRAGGIIVAFQDRLSRENGLGTAEVWEALEHVGAVLIACDGIDSRTEGSEMLFSIKAAVARDQWKRYKANWAKATEHSVAAGKYQGYAPVGFDRLLNGTLRQNDAAPVVREAFLARANGRSWNRLADLFESRGVRTATGAEKWHINSVRSLIGNPIYKGTLKNGHEHHFPAYAIVTPSEWEAAQPAPPSGPSGGRKDRGKWAILGGLLTCQACGSILTPNGEYRHEKFYGYYVCKQRGCTEHARVNADEIHALVCDAAVEHFAYIVAAGRIKLGREVNVERVTELEQARDAAEDELASFLRTARASDPGFEDAVEARRAEFESAKAALTDEQGVSEVTMTPENWRASWSGWTVEEKREALGRIIDRVTVAKVGTKLTEFQPVASTELAHRLAIEYAVA